jgi:hypothetical protein
MIDRIMSARGYLRYIAIVAWLPAIAMAQVAGTISGFVTDASGSPVPAAKLTAVLLEQQVQRAASRPSLFG